MPLLLRDNHGRVRHAARACRQILDRIGAESLPAGRRLVRFQYKGFGRDCSFRSVYGRPSSDSCLRLPLVANAKFEFRDARRRLDSVDGREKVVYVNPLITWGFCTVAMFIPQFLLDFRTAAFG